MRIITPVGERLTLGMRVKLTNEGRHHLGSYRSAHYNSDTRGTVVGYGRKRGIVIILKDGYRSKSSYASIFWEPA